MRLDGNLLAGVAQSIWSAVLALAVVPLYLKFLGIEAYGLIAFFTSAQILLQLLDMGLAPTMNREVARASAQKDYAPARILLHSLSLVYWTTAGVLALTIAALSPLISQHWLHAKTLPQQSINNAVILMGFVIACRWPIGIYQGAIMGAQRLTIASVINVAMVTLGSVGSVCLLALLSPRVEVFFAWQAAVGIAFALTMRWAAWNVIGRTPHLAFDWLALRRVWRFSAGMSGVALSGIVLMQLDKILLSRILTLEAFGAYALAATLSSGLYVLLTPTFNVIYPRLSAMVATGDDAAIVAFYRVGTRLLLACLFPLAAFVSVYSSPILELWTRNPVIAAHAAPIVSMFIIGTALNGAMHFPYALQLAHGSTRIPLKINAILLVLTVPLTIILARKYGAIGGASSWALVNALYVVIGTWITHRHLLIGLAWRWIASDVGVPILLSLAIVGGLDSRRFLQSNHIAVTLAFGVFSCVLATVTIAATSGPVRAALQHLTGYRDVRVGEC